MVPRIRADDVYGWIRVRLDHHYSYHTSRPLLCMSRIREMPDATASGAIFAGITGFTTILGAALVIAVGAGIVVAWMNVANRFTSAEATEMGLAVATILVGVITVMIFVCIFCSSVHPTERFTDINADPAQTLLSGIADAEQKVCELVQRTDKFIESDVGKPGQDDPSLVIAAQRKARANVPGSTIVDCTVGAPETSNSYRNGSYDLSISARKAEPSLADAAERLTLLELTLKWFTGPELDATYAKAMAGCESFEDGAGTLAPTLPSLQTRLTAVQATIADQHRRRLDPLDAQTARLQRGEVSECQKKMGASAGADAAAAAKKPPAGTPMTA